MSLKARIEKLEQDLQQLVGDHEAALRDGGSHDDSNLQYHLGSALCDVQSCHDYLRFASDVPPAGEPQVSTVGEAAVRSAEIDGDDA